MATGLLANWILGRGGSVARGLVFHALGSRRGWGFSYYPTDRFSALCTLIHEQGRSVVPVTQAVLIPANSDSVVLTFDDGFSCFYEHALPVLQQLGLRATIFPVAAWIGKTSTWDIFPPQKHCSAAQLREIALLGHEVGSHTLTHPDLRLLDTQTLICELRDSKSLLEDVTGMPVTAISFPFGSWDRRVWECCLDQGYCAGSIYHYHNRRAPAMISVAGVYAFDTVEDAAARIGSAPRTPAAMVRGRIMPHFAKGTALWKFRSEYRIGIQGKDT